MKPAVQSHIQQVIHYYSTELAQPDVFEFVFKKYFMISEFLLELYS